MNKLHLGKLFRMCGLHRRTGRVCLCAATTEAARTAEDFIVDILSHQKSDGVQTVSCYNARSMPMLPLALQVMATSRSYLRIVADTRV